MVKLSKEVKDAIEAGKQLEKPPIKDKDLLEAEEDLINLEKNLKKTLTPQWYLNIKKGKKKKK